MSIFGNGVIGGWDVTKGDGLSVTVTPGRGNIRYTSARTQFPVTIRDLPASSVVYIYARLTNTTRLNETVEFFKSPLSNIGDSSFLLLARVVTGAFTVQEITTSVRQDIGFIELIRDAIKDHKHRGGADNPSKIDLSSEVKGQLPSFRIADLDAEKIASGTFELERLPLIDHSELLNVGLLTHPQLDSFVKTLEVGNRELFGEISTANLLQMLIAMKFVHDDPTSPFYVDTRYVDENWINAFTVIPGITPDSFIDFNATTAQVNLADHYVKGIPPSTGTSFYVNYDSALAWNAAYTQQHVAVTGSSVTLAYRDDNEQNLVVVEGFESATANGQNLSSLFKKETVVRQDNASLTASNSALNVVEGFWSGKFKHQQKFRNQFVKEFSEAQNWSTYDTFSIYVKCTDSLHGAVKFYFVSSTNELSIDYTLLEEDEITENADPAANGFEQRSISLMTVPFRDRISKIVIYTDDLDSAFSFYVDQITIQRAVLLPDDGTIVLRYSSSSRLTFSNIEWNAIEPSGTNITVRVRAADGTVYLTRADWTPYLTNGEPVNLQGTDLEIEIKLYPDSEKIQAPILNWLRVLILTQAEIDGYQIDSVEEFGRGSSENTRITTPAAVVLDTPIYVDSYYFAEANRVNQGHVNSETGTEFMEMDDVFMDGGKTPISPNSIFSFVESGNSGRLNHARLFEPRSVRRQTDRSFLVADTYNDRILSLSEDGDLLGGFGSIGYSHANKTFPIAASLDTRTGILYVVWSRSINFRNVDVAHITLQSTTRSVRLVKDFDKIMGLSSAELAGVNAEGQILPIYLSAQNAAEAQKLPGENQSYIFIDQNALSEMNTDSVFYRTVVSELGIPLFVGKFAYIDGIFTPTWADRTETNGYIVCNAKTAVKDWSFPSGVSESLSKKDSVSDILMLDENHNVVFGKDGLMQFSPFVPGRAEKLGDRLLIGGLKPGGQDGTPQSGRVFNFRTVRGDSPSRQEQKRTLNDLFFGGPSPYVGSVVVYDLRSGSTVFEYISPEGMLVSDVDIDPVTGYYIVAESSVTKSGRVIKLDANGNIVFSFGEGLYSLINDVFVQYDGSVVVST